MIKNPARNDNNPIGQRLKSEMQKRGVTSAELAKRADVKTSFIYDVLSGKSVNPSPIKLARVADGLGINLLQLVEQPGLSKRRSLQNDEYVSIPRLMMEVSASGKPVFSDEESGQPYCFRAVWIQEHLGVAADQLRIFVVRGDNMEPTLSHNDVVLVDTSKRVPSPPGIFVVFDGLGMMPKRLEYAPQTQPERVRIISDNTQYSTYERSPEDANVIGRVVWVSREI